MLELLKDVAEEFPIKKNVAYFNNASYTPISTSVTRAISEALTGYSRSGPNDEYYLKLKEAGNVTREKLSKLLNCPKDGIVFTESATQSINLVANGFKVARDDCIVTRGGSSEHPSNFLPWKYYADQKQVRIIDLKTDELGLPDLAELDSVLKQSKAKLVIVSHVLYNLGTVMPVIEVCRIGHENGAQFFLDASQSVGSMPVDLKLIDCDYAAGTAAKWICGPLGLGFLYCKKEVLDSVAPLNFGANACTYTPEGSYKVLDTAARLQEGFRNWIYCYGFSAAIDLITFSGVEGIRKKNLDLADHIIENLSSLTGYRFIGSTEPKTRTSILPFEVSGKKPIEIVQRLSKANITVAEREIKEKKILRISPHFYNDEEEANRLVKELGMALI